MRGVQGSIIPPAPTTSMCALSISVFAAVATATTGNRDDIRSARTKLMDFRLEPRTLEPAGRESGDICLTRSTRHQIRIGRVDGH